MDVRNRTRITKPKTSRNKQKKLRRMEKKKSCKRKTRKSLKRRSRSRVSLRETRTRTKLSWKASVKMKRRRLS